VDDTGPAFYCKPVADFPTQARDLYWLSKALAWIESHPFPIP
jgi:hypothetical protein